MDEATIAKRICERLGIEWDERLSVPHLRDVPVSGETVKMAFDTEGELYQTGISTVTFLICDSTAVPEYNANNAIVLAA